MVLTALLMVAVSGSELVPSPPLEPGYAAAVLAQAEPPKDPDANGRGYLKHAYALASVGTSMAIGGGIGVSLTVASSLSCAARPGCRDEGGSAMGYLLSAPFLILGASMIAFAIPLFIKGFRERFAVPESLLD